MDDMTANPTVTASSSGAQPYEAEAVGNIATAGNENITNAANTEAHTESERQTEAALDVDPKACDDERSSGTEDKDSIPELEKPGDTIGDSSDESDFVKLDPEVSGSEQMDFSTFSALSSSGSQFNFMSRSCIAPKSPLDVESSQDADVDSDDSSTRLEPLTQSDPGQPSSTELTSKVPDKVSGEEDLPELSSGMPSDAIDSFDGHSGPHTRLSQHYHNNKLWYWLVAVLMLTFFSYSYTGH
ncbi:PREDICTED: uncharacterized protein LOC106812481 [Priapulus caudatus]|uniref:Uncharacterized protein LOC106812481 n=1 Tax=Priapulus caudatus TaxID=37621 RepID=A0ABM1EI30_PRICU|nr:PREDICTED: uncharacterized protein LOC106812481 [Priapulus caudatus]